MDDHLESALKRKERTISDLVRFITTHPGNSSKYHLLLGAGCSITSGIKSAKKLSEDWLKDIYMANNPNEKEENYTSEKAREFLKNEDNGYWYNPNHEYSCLFEKRFDLPSQRRSFVEEEVGGKFPSIGYAYLIRLIEKHYFNTIFTTNFDDLLNEAFHLFAESEYSKDKERDMMRPIVCAHDSSVKSISVTSERPKIIKLHGDYLFEDIKSTERETESLEDNIRSKFVEFCKDFGLIVVGYSGNDRSVMDVINMLLKNDDYLKNGLYWCIRKEDELSDELRKLLWKERVYYVYIDGFDELFAELYKSVSQDNDSSPLPISLPHKNELIMRRLVDNTYLSESKSTIIQDEIEKLKSEIKKNSFFNNMKEIWLSDDKNGEYQEYSFEETSNLIEIDRLVDAKKYLEAISKVTTQLKKEDISFEFKEQLLRNAARISKRLDKMEDAIRYCDLLIEMNPNKVNSYFFKNNILVRYDDIINNMRECLSLNKYCYECYEKITDLEFQLLSKSYKSEERNITQYQLLEDLNAGLLMNPHFENECFQTKFSFLISYKNAIQSNWNEACRKEIIDIAKQQNPEHPLCFYYQHRLLNADNKPEDYKKEELAKLWTNLYERFQSNFDQYLPTALSFLDDELIVDQEKIDRVKELLKNNMNRLRKNANFQRNLSKFYAIRCGEFSKALDIISSIPDDKINMDDLYTLRFYGEMLKDYSLAEKTMQRVRSDFSLARQFEIDYILAEMRKDFGASLEAINMMNKYAKCPYDHFNQHIYTLLELKEYQQVYDLSNQMLHDIPNPNDRQTCDIVNYEIARKLYKKNERKSVLDSIITTTSVTRMKVAAFFILGKTNDGNKLITKDIAFNFEALHYYEQTLVFNLFKNEDTDRILQKAHLRVK